MISSGIALTVQESPIISFSVIATIAFLFVFIYRKIEAFDPVEDKLKFEREIFRMVEKGYEESDIKAKKEELEDILTKEDKNIAVKTMRELVLKLHTDFALTSYCVTGDRDWRVFFEFEESFEYAQLFFDSYQYECDGVYFFHFNMQKCRNIIAQRKTDMQDFAELELVNSIIKNIDYELEIVYN